MNLYINRNGHFFKLNYLEYTRERVKLEITVPDDILYVRQGGEEGSRFIDFEGGPFIMEGSTLTIFNIDDRYTIKDFFVDDYESLIINLESAAVVE